MSSATSRSRSGGGGGRPQHFHEKPAAVLAAAIARSTLGRVQVVAASATVGRPLRRELARVLGLLPHEGPSVLRAGDNIKDDGDDEATFLEDATFVLSSKSKLTTGRAVTIPETVEHYIHIINGTASEGKLLTGAFGVLQRMSTTQQRPEEGTKREKKILLVLCKNFGKSTQNVVGALKHFKCQPEPQSLLDVLQGTTSTTTNNDDRGTDPLMERHRQVSGATGVGESAFGSNDISDSKNLDHDNGYLLVTGEDSVRGLHLDGLDLVLMVGRPKTPDDYTHIAGRTGRAGQKGQVVAVVSSEQAVALQSWERMLQIKFSNIVSPQQHHEQQQ
ncbi:hypothetical protein ACA910_010591 [Epithemia clementina (nom. ined.)]